MNENIAFLSSRVILAENSANGNMVAKFCLCDFGVNHNGVQLNRDTIESWVSSLVNQPLVGRIGYNGDFTGHNMRVATVVNADGEQEQTVVFDTEAIGTFISAGIEEIDGQEYVVGTAEIWRRYPTVCNLIAERVNKGTLHTSWEIMVTESHEEGTVKVIDDGCFTALCALGRNHPPAYDSSQLLEVAESESDTELEAAISCDVAQFKAKEDHSMTETTEIQVEIPEVSEEPIVVDTAEPEVDTATETPESVEEDGGAETSEQEPEVSEQEEPAAETETEVSALTERDLYDKIGNAVRQHGHDGYVSYLFPEEHSALFHVWEPDFCELEYMQFNYTVNGDEVTVDDGIKVRLEATPVAMSQMISEKNEALIEASQRIKGLEAELAELRPFKEAAEKAEAERLAAEKQEQIAALEQYVLKSGFVTSEEISNDGDVKTMIAELNKAGIKQLIADRFMASLQNEKPAEPAVSEKEPKIETAELNLEVSDDDDASIVTLYINKSY